MAVATTPITEAFLSNQFNKQLPLEASLPPSQSNVDYSGVPVIDGYRSGDEHGSSLSELADRSSHNSGLDGPEDTPTTSDRNRISSESEDTPTTSDRNDIPPKVAVIRGKEQTVSSQKKDSLLLANVRMQSGKIAKIPGQVLSKAVKVMGKTVAVFTAKDVNYSEKTPRAVRITEKHVEVGKSLPLVEKTLPSITTGLVGRIRSYLQRKPESRFTTLIKPAYDRSPPHYPSIQSMRYYNSGTVITYNGAARVNGGASILSGRKIAELSKISSPPIFNSTQVVVDAFRRDLVMREVVLSGRLYQTANNFSDYLQLHCVPGRAGGEIAALHYHCITPGYLDGEHANVRTVSEADVLPNIERIIKSGLKVYELV